MIIVYAVDQDGNGSVTFRSDQEAAQYDVTEQVKLELQDGGEQFVGFNPLSLFGNGPDMKAFEALAELSVNWGNASKETYLEALLTQVFETGIGVGLRMAQPMMLEIQKVLAKNCSRFQLSHDPLNIP